MNARVLPILNAIGCLVLTGLVAVQWHKERALNSDMDQLGSQLSDARRQAADETSRRTALERDIAVLKESIEATQKSAESAASDLAAKQELAEKLQTDLSAATQQVAAWEAALKERDAKITQLNSDLAATRQRLDEAIAKLKAVGAR
jgi:predicted  nucleic acid-binding Zn-ribbon protein